MFFNDGTAFIGKLTDKKTLFSGMLTFPNGDVYDGDFKNNNLLLIIKTFGKRCIVIKCSIVIKILFQKNEQYSNIDDW